MNEEECPRPIGCRCKPVCRVCGWGRHAAVHLPAQGAPAGSVAWGHEFEPDLAKKKGVRRWAQLRALQRG